MSDYDWHRPPATLKEAEILQGAVLEQMLAAAESGEVACVCSRTRPLVDAYRCYCCGLWFCLACARKHFGPRPKAFGDVVETRPSAACCTGEGAP